MDRDDKSTDRANSLDETSGYVPATKEAPIPATETPGSVSGEKVVKGGDNVAPLQQFRKPRHPYTQKVIDGVKGAITGSTVPDKGSNKQPLPPVDKKRLYADVDAEDKRRLRAMQSYGPAARKELLPRGIVLVLRGAGLKGVPASHVDAIVKVLLKGTYTAGYRVTAKGDLAHRKLPIDKLVAYTLGSTALKLDEWGAGQWLKHPTIFDLLAVGVATTELAFDIADKNGPFARAVYEAYKATQPVQPQGREAEDPNIAVNPV